MSFWTGIRDTVETVAVVAGNYFLPGSSILTSKLVSKDAKETLDSDLGVLAQLASGGFGIANNQLANYGKIFGTTAAAGTPAATTGATQGLAGADLAGAAGAGGVPIDVTAAYTPAANSAQVLTTPPADTGFWSTAGKWLEKPGNVAMLGLGMQGAGMVMGGLGSSAQAKALKEKQDYERAQSERQVANINSSTYNPVKAKQRPGIINAQATTRSVLGA